MPVTRIVWSAHAEDRRSRRLIYKAAVEHAILVGHAGRKINRGDADWRIDGRLADGQRFVVVYDHAARSRPGTALVMSVWDL